MVIGHVERVPEEETVKNVFKNIPEGKKFRCKAKTAMLDDVKNYLKNMDVRGWRNVARD
jgi:hypothetical protein